LLRARDRPLRRGRAPGDAVQSRGSAATVEYRNIVGAKSYATIQDGSNFVMYNELALAGMLLTGKVTPKLT